MIAAVAALVPGTLPRPATAQAPGQPVEAVQIPFPRDDGSLTPYSFQLGYPLLTMVYDTLLWRDPNGVAQPWLATALDTNPEATRFTLRLNPGARWHDGTPLTAEDVRFTFRYVAEQPHPRFSAEVAEVTNVAAPDPTTVVITTRRPAPGFPDQTLADLPILPAHLWRSLPAGQTSPPGLPVGSGPYRLVERPPGGGYRFEANSSYFKGPPRAAQIVVPILSDLGGTLGAFRRGSVDMVPLRLPPDDVRAVEGLGSRVARGPSYWGVQLVFNMRRAPFNDPARRQAVAKAMDLDRLARTIGDAVPARRGMLHPDSPWAPPDILQATDEQAARTALAGLTSNIEVLSADNDPVHIDTARQVALALQRMGVPASAANRPVADLNRALGTEGARPDFTLAVTAMSPASSYDPDYLARVFGSGTATTSGYSSAAFDQIALRLATTVDRQARQAATTEELRLLATDLPSLPLLFPNGAFAYRPGAYDGWRYVRGIGILDKQSFLAAAPGEQTGTTTTSRPPPAPTPGTAPGAAPPERGFPIGVVPLGLGLAALALMALALVRGRR